MRWLFKISILVIVVLFTGILLGIVVLPFIGDDIIHKMFPDLGIQKIDTALFIIWLGFTGLVTAFLVSRYLSEIEFEEMLIYKGYSPEEIKMLKYMTFDEWYKKVNPEGYREWKEKKRELEKPREVKTKPKVKESIPIAISNKGLVVGAKSNIICPNCGSKIVPIKLKSGDLLCPICGINLVEGKGSSIGEKNVK